MGAIDDGLLTTDRSIQKVEQLIGQLGEKDEDMQSVERLLMHFAGMRRRLEAVRACLVAELVHAPAENLSHPSTDK